VDPRGGEGECGLGIVSLKGVKLLFDNGPNGGAIRGRNRTFAWLQIPRSGPVGARQQDSEQTKRQGNWAQLRRKYPPHGSLSIASVYFIIAATAPSSAEIF
tara:strand:- start:15251 stop:15553 length:303 start_codon:yes stop_codon:yes gene_type:complete